MTDLEFWTAPNSCCWRWSSLRPHQRQTDADLDAQRVGGMVTLVFANRSQIVINQQKPLHEIWLAAKAGGFHYRLDGEQWLDTKGLASSLNV
jgi:CyaY protein